MYLSEHYVAAFLAVFISVISNIYLKKGAVDKSKNITEMINAYSFVGLSLFFIVTLLQLYALKVVQLHEMAFIIPALYIFTPLAAFYVFNEKITKNMIVGMVFIFIGMITFNIDL